jgi:hypothetical protein
MKKDWLWLAGAVAVLVYLAAHRKKATPLSVYPSLAWMEL